MNDFGDRLFDQSAKKLALLAERVRAAPQHAFLSEPIAITGMACRFPGASNVMEFWDLLIRGGDTVTEIPSSRWDASAWYDTDPATPGKSYSRWGAFIDKADEFDAEFFGVSPREASQMDPRQRLLLETAWEALENAGQSPSGLAGSDAGVFIGHMVGDYYRLQTDGLTQIDSYVSTGNLDAILANRLSYALNLQGPSLAVDTACSSSLIAVHLACQSLRQEECEIAIAGGVNLMLSPEMHVMGAKSRLLSASGRCRTFDRSADGFVRGEGCGLVVLRRLSDALAGGDNIVAVIRGSALNQDGKTNGISAPNGLSQQRVIRRALRNALIEPASVTFVETHGTGTLVGDAIEFEALAEVYGGPSEWGPCRLGAVKTNVGHLEGAAGIAGLIKATLCLARRRIPPNLHCREVNPHIGLKETRFLLPREAEPWTHERGPRRAAVSAFGLGGSNAHVILEEAPTPATPMRLAERPLHLLTLAARDEHALRDLASRYDAFLAERSDVGLADLAYTANVGRTHFPRRAAILFDDAAALRTGLRHLELSEAPSSQLGIAFLFSDIATVARCGTALYAEWPLFRRSVDECRRLGASADGRVIAYALARLWQAWGIRPRDAVGNGAGALALRCIDGEIGLAEALAAEPPPLLSQSEIAERIRALHRRGCNAFVEIGPASTLIDIGRASVSDPGVLWLPSCRPGVSATRQMLESLAALYVRGADVDWIGFDRDFDRRKLSLPTYPFRRQRYWLAGSSGADMPADWASLLYRPAWVPHAARAAPAGSISRWLVVEHGAGASGGDLVALLRRSGQEATLARGAPSTTSDHRGVVLACGAAASADAASEAEAASGALIRLVQAAAAAPTPPRLWLVTRGTQAVSGKQPIEVGYGALWGLMRTVRFEHPELQAVSIDLDPAGDDLSPAVGEMLAPGEAEVAFRSGARHVLRLDRAHLGTAVEVPIRADASYLITGGLGALGQAVARSLVAQGARHLVLAGRNPDHKPGVDELRAAGATVEVVRADIARHGDAARLIAQCQARAPLRGVVHAAGVLDDGILAGQTTDRLARVMAPKARGGWNLHVLTQAIELDFFVCFSSVASLLGSPGQSSYAAANAFLDSLAHHRSACGLPALSINWGPWAGEGMAAHVQSRLRAHGERPIDPDLGGRLFLRTLSSGAAAQIAIADVDWPTYAATYPSPTFLERLSVPLTASARRQRLLAAPADARAGLLEELVEAEVARVLGRTPGSLPRGKGFADLGMDSLSALELRTQLERELDCRLTTTLAFDYPTIELLTGFLMTLLPPNIAADGLPSLNVGADDLDGDEDIAALLARELASLEGGRSA